MASARTDAAGARPLAGAERLATALAVAALIALPFVIYWRSLSDFFMLDDFIWLKAAAGHGAIDLLRRETSFSTPLDPFDYPTPYIRPLVDAYFFVTWRIFGLDPRAYHALNLALHACVGLAVAVLGWQLLRSKVAGLLGAALFLALPTYDFAVTWVSEATDLIFTLFYLLSLSLFLAHLRRAPPMPLALVLRPPFPARPEPAFPARPEALEGRPGGAGATRASSFAASVRHEAPGSARPEPVLSRSSKEPPDVDEGVVRSGEPCTRWAARGGAPYFASLAAFTLALLAKEPAITLAGVAALAAFAEAENLSRDAIRRRAFDLGRPSPSSPLPSTSVLYRREYDTISGSGVYRLDSRLFGNYWDYLKWLAFPFDPDSGHEVARTAAALAFLALGGLVIATRQKTLAFLFLWTLVALLPLSLFAHGIDHRYAYLVSIPFALFLVGLVQQALRGLTHAPMRRNLALAALVLLALPFLAYRSPRAAGLGPRPGPSLRRHLHPGPSGLRCPPPR